MFTGALERRIQYLVLFCVVSMTLIVTPWISLDPINSPKFLVLGTCGFAVLGNLFPYLKRLIDSDARFLFYAVLLFLISLVASFLSSDSGKWQQLFGVYGRNTGLIAYLSLSLILLATVFVTNFSFARKLIWSLTATGIFNAIYGMVQWSGNDPINWNNLYNSILGTLGNPNFVSAHLGISGIAALSLGLEKSRNVVSRVILLGSVGLSFFVAFQSDSSQGLYIFVFGTVIVLYFRFLKPFHFLIKSSYWTLIATSLICGILGVLNKGPLASRLYETSVTLRGDYWRAGWKMTADNPFFGVGLDSYGDWYRASRGQSVVLRVGPEVTSNSAHNVFLDMSSSGGFFLLFSYLLIITIILRSCWRILSRIQNFDSIGVALVSAWLAYLIQSSISINQLGLAIWGWALGGSIIGYDLCKDGVDVPRVKERIARKPEQVPAAVVLTGTLGVFFGFLVSVWPAAQDINFRKALETGSVIEIEDAVNHFPRNNYYLVFASNLLQQSNFEEKALTLAKRATVENPRDFNAWKILAANPKIGDADKLIAIQKMRELDPFNMTLRQS